MSPHTAAYAEALAALDLLMGWADRWMPVTCTGNGRSRLVWHRCGNPRALQVLVDGFDEVTLGLPQPKRFHGGPTGATVLWCVVTGSAQLEAARKFRPLPSFVVAEGATSKRLLMWPLRERAGYQEVTDANRKIAYRLRATQKHGEPECLAVPAPGSVTTGKRAKGVAVRVARLTLEDYTVRQVTGRLRTPPDVKWWEAA